MRKIVIGAIIMAASVSMADLVSVMNARSIVNTNYYANQAVTGNGTSGTALNALTGHALLKCAGGVINSEAVLVMKLPVLSAGETITNANLSITGVRSFETLWNIDLYAIRSASAPTVSTSDYGAFGDSASGTKLVNNIFTPADANAVYLTKSTDDTADLALATWLMDQYTLVGAGGYVFFRLQPDNAAAIGDSNAYNISGAANTTYAIPALTISTAIPEPATIGMFGLGALIVVLVRRMR